MEKRKPKIGDKFYSKSLEQGGFFPEWATQEYIDKMRKRYRNTHIEDFIVDWDNNYKGYEPQGYDLEDMVFNEEKDRWEERY